MTKKLDFDRTEYNQDAYIPGGIENYLDPTEDYDQTLENVERKLELEELGRSLYKLKQQQRQAIVLKFGLLDRVYTQIEIADLLGVSQSYVSKLIKDGLQELLRWLDPEQAVNKARIEFIKLLFDEPEQVA